MIGSVLGERNGEAKEAGQRLRYTLLGTLLLMEVVWLALVTPGLELKRGPSGEGLAADFGMLAGAAQVVRDGGNPYDRRALYAAESGLLHRQGLAMTTDRGIVRVGNPPAYLWALQPVTQLPFKVAGYVWAAVSYAILAASFVVLLRYFEWSVWLAPCILFLLMPQVVKAVYHGNSMVLVFAAVSTSLALSKRHGFAAGLILLIAWVKPQIGLFPVLLIFLFEAERRERFAAGFVTGTLGLLALISATTGLHSVVAWVRGLMDYSHDVAPQKVVPSVAGLYVLWAPWHVRLLLTALGVAVAVSLTGLWWWKLRNAEHVPFLAVAWLWLVWFLATPYVHVDDEVLLAIPLLALVGRNGERLSRPLPALAVILVFFAPSPPSWVIVDLALPLLLFLVIGCLQRDRDWRWALGAYALLAVSVAFNVLRLPADAGTLKLVATAVCLFAAANETEPQKTLRERWVDPGSRAAGLQTG